MTISSMSQFAEVENVPRDIAMAERGPDDVPNLPPTQQDQTAQGESNISDGSEVLFSVYLKRAIKEDTKMVESWKGDTEGILLLNIRKLYIALHECFTTPPTAFYTVTDDRDPILDNPRSYPMCSIDDHGPSEPLPDLQFDEPTPDIAGDGPSTPGVQMPIPFTYPPIRSSGVYTPSPPYHTLSPPAHYGPRYIDTSSYLGSPRADTVAPFPQPQLTPMRQTSSLE